MMRVKRNLGDANSLGVSKSPEDGEDQVETEPPPTVAARYCMNDSKMFRILNHEKSN